MTNGCVPVGKMENYELTKDEDPNVESKKSPPRPHTIKYNGDGSQFQ